MGDDPWPVVRVALTSTRDLPSLTRGSGVGVEPGPVVRVVLTSAGSARGSSVRLTVGSSVRLPEGSSVSLLGAVV